MWEIWIHGDPNLGSKEETLAVPNLCGDWEPPGVDEMWGIFKVTKVDEIKGEVTLEVADSSLLTPIP